MRTLRRFGSHVIGLSLFLAACSNDSDEGKLSVDAAVGVIGSPTWHEDIAPIVIAKCSGCHAEGGIAPFSMESYELAKPHAGFIASAANAGTMPPFLAQDTDECEPRLPWKHDLRLSAEEKKTLSDWAAAGAPEGDAAKAQKTTPPALAKLEREDVVMKLPYEVTVDGKKDSHTCFVVDPKLAEDSYVVGRLITSGNDKVLHHVVSYVITPGTNSAGETQTKAELEAALMAEKSVGIGGSYDCFGGPGLQTLQTQMLDAWAPGGVPNLAPPDSGQPIAKDSLVLLDVHYHPTGSGPEKDSETRLSLMLAQEKPTYVSRIVLLGNFERRLDTQFGVGDIVKQAGESEAKFLIPAGAKDHVEELTWVWKLPGIALRVFATGTHMHYVGRDMLVRLRRAEPIEDEPEEECLIHTPAWDFNWQRGYAYDAPYEDLPQMREGDTLELRCLFDNTMDNPFVVQALEDQGLDAPVDVVLGEDTLNEMCLAAIGIIYPNL